MSESAALPLPSGFRDRLGEEAERLSALVRTVLDTCRAHGFRRVQPTLVEHEATLSAWLADGVQPSLRLADPLTGEALALRPDLTGQVARIAATRLHRWPRPLRLAYGGPVLRARGTPLDPSRERTQAGAEIVGTDRPAAVAASIGLALEALKRCGATQLAVDLALPELFGHLAASAWPVADVDALADALEAKDEVRVWRLGGERYRRLLGLGGPARAALAGLAELPAPAGLLENLDALVGALEEAGLSATLDPAERQGFRYHSWLGFTLFGAVSPGSAPIELGRGGAYRIAAAEPAVGFSLYLDALAEGLGGAAADRRLFMPYPADPRAARRLRDEGWQVVEALAPEEQGWGCSHVWDGGRARPAEEA